MVLVAVALAATWAGGGGFALLWLAAAVAIVFEWNGMTRTEPRSGLILASAAGLVGLAAAHQWSAAWPVFASVVLGSVLAVAVLGRDGRSRLWAVSGFAYAAVVALVPSLVRDDPALGITGIGWLFAVVWTTDIVAYFVGRSVGGPKLWPSVSPKKTWSGFLGGLVGAVAAGMLVVHLSSQLGGPTPFGLIAVGAASGLASVASQFGDLAESALKRRFGAKDSGRLIPGHGGVMDRLDGFVAVALLCGLAMAGSRLAR